MFKSVDIGTFRFNPFDELGKRHFLVTAGTKDGFNTMTAAWGSMGVMWYKNITTCVIRPERYTKRFVDGNDFYSLCFFGSDKKDVLSYCGSHSGRDADKCKQCGITPLFDEDAPYFAEAETIFICRKIYVDDIKPQCFLDKSLDTKWYPEKDYHTAYTGEICKILIKE